MADVNIDHFSSEEILEINDKLPLEEDIIEISDLFKNFSDSTRVKILLLLLLKSYACKILLICLVWASLLFLTSLGSLGLQGL